MFVHISAVERAGLSTLKDGQKVSFELTQDRRSARPRRTTFALSERIARLCPNTALHDIIISPPVTTDVLARRVEMMRKVGPVPAFFIG